MFSHHDNTLKVQQVVMYAAAGDAFTELYNQTEDNALQNAICDKVDELKRNSLALSSQEFIDYINKLINEFNLQDVFKKHSEHYQKFCQSLLNPTEASQQKMAVIFDPANKDKLYEADHSSINLLLRAFVDCRDDLSLKAMLEKMPAVMKNEMLYSLLPKCFIAAVLDFNPVSARIALELGMPADTKQPWRNFFGDTMYISLLTHVLYHAGQMINRVGSKSAKANGASRFNEAELDAYAAIIRDLLLHGADCDFDKRHPSDEATPRGLARSKLDELQKNEYLTDEDKAKMAAVLQLVANHDKSFELQSAEVQTKRQKY